MAFQIHNGDCLEVMGSMADNGVDTIITDPPYGLSFMGKDWDHGVPGPAFWREALRIAKPGSMLMAFGGTRTFHRLTCAIEDAGWEIRDCIMWVYGSGFPKSHDISKALDKAAGVEREVVGVGPYHNPNSKQNWTSSGICEQIITAPSTDAAKTWNGWGTALKPAWEPIILAMKLLDGTFAENAEKWGVAGLWIDGGRIEASDSYSENRVTQWVTTSQTPYTPAAERRTFAPSASGRWPANLIHDGSEECLSLFPPSMGDSPDRKPRLKRADGFGFGGPAKNDTTTSGYSDQGSAARFFYCAKASPSERNSGLSGGQKNSHPTVKPLALMRYLCRLTRMPEGGLVLDPFMGSGSTGIAALSEGRSFVGIEKNAEYCEIARKRIESESDLFAEAES